MNKRNTKRAESRARLREQEQLYRALAQNAELDNSRLRNQYWIKQATEFEKKAEILLSKAKTCRLKHNQLIECATENDKEIRDNLLRAGVCKTILLLEGKAGDICLCNNPKNAVDIYLHLLWGENDKAQRVLERDINI